MTGCTGRVAGRVQPSARDVTRGLRPDIEGRRCPSRARATSNSSRRTTRARSTPAWPPAASAQKIGRPTSTPRAPEREGDGDVEATAHAAIDPELGPPDDGAGDLGERVDRGRHAVELTPAVVAHHDAVDPVLHREVGILGGQDPLDDQRQSTTSSGSSRGRSRKAQPGSGPPGDRGRWARGCHAWRRSPRSCRAAGAPTGLAIALPIRHHRQVDGQDDGAESRPPRPARRASA